jgi:putative ABC transport system permease protein
MPEFRRGLGRFLPRSAERDLFHPSLQDLRAERNSGLRLEFAIIALWIDCWRVWLSNFGAGQSVNRRTSYAVSRASRGRKEYWGMFMQDVRRALRLFRMEPGFAAAAVATLALGIGANTALFAVVEAVLLRPLPVAGADELVILKHRALATGISKEFIAVGDLLDFRDRIRTLEQVAGFSNFQNTLFGDDEPMRVEGLSMTPDGLAALQLQPAMGRLFDAAEARQGAQPVALISHELWETRFGSDPNILSRSVQIGNARRMVVGVMPPGFHFPPGATTQVIVPMALPATPPPQRQNGWIPALGRLRDGETVESANAEFEALSTEFEGTYPDQNRGTRYYVEPLRDALVGDTKRPLLLLFGAVGFVLLIACVNVGNLLLARSLARRQEMAVRTAMGASWTRLASQLLIEGLVLALAGCAIGVVLAWQLAPALAGMVPETARVPGLQHVGLNPAVVVFSIAASVISALMFGGIACISLARHDQRAALAVTRGTTMSGGARRAASMLVMGEIALAGILLVAAGLTLRSFANLIATDPGFNTANVLTVQLVLPSVRYPNAPARAELYERVFSRLQALPGVEHVGVAVVTPLTGNNWTIPFARVDQPPPAGVRPPDVGWQSATGGYFQALQIPLVAGRLFEDRDATSPVPAAIISESIAREHFAGESPLGRRLRSGPNEIEIVGVVGDIRRAALSDGPRADMYLAFARNADAFSTLFVRTAGDPMQAYPEVRAALRSLEPQIMVMRPRSMEEVAAASTATTRLAMRLLAGFAAVALTLAAVGIYAVMAYSVRRRMRELGTRLALGASRRDIISLVMREGGVITVVGVIAGLGAGLFAAQSLSAVLHGVPASDPVSLSVAAILLSITAMAACYVPARRASRIDPARTLIE